MLGYRKALRIALGLLVFLVTLGLKAQTAAAPKAEMEKLQSELVGKYGAAERDRIARGLAQVAEFWRPSDGTPADMEQFVRTNFAADPATREALFERLQMLQESLDGHMNEIIRDFRRQSDLDLGPIYPFDEILAGYDPSAHVVDDFFANRLAFVVLLNFPLTTLEQRLTAGASWSRRNWAEARLAQRFGRRVPAEVNLEIARAGSEAAQYIAGYNVWMHHVLGPDGSRLFPAGMRLLSHWNLRDEIKSDYRDAKTGLAKQRTIEKVMERIVTQTIPRAALDNPGVDWNPFTNEVRPAAVKDSDRPLPPGRSAETGPEPDTRYARLLEVYRACRKADPYSPTAPTLMARRFNEDREIPEPRFRRMLESVLSSPLVPRVAKLVSARVGRPLEPFDIWYAGFTPKGTHSEAELDEIVRKRYPTPEAYKKDIPNLLQHLGFTREKAEWLAANIVVDPARGSGHALGALRRGDQAHLRTRVEKNGMNYKGFNIAVHEMGHNVEQTFSLNAIDYTLLQGVPNNAFTEALAFVFQAHDLELLGLPGPDAESRAARTVEQFWATYEIAGVALVDMDVWDWMYAHPDATPAQLKEATLSIAKNLWNRWYAPVFGKKDVALLGIYSHMIDSFLYLPDYPLGHMIAFQIERKIESSGNLGAEFERMARLGRIAPDLWMQQATGSPVGPEALLAEAAKAVPELEGARR
ncbi:MAG TPA: hypothetical protein VE007_11640 [Thermoanaerobaculia bacterium]|nr:hypothetical protein [Thermoanaerobaculia bacterium]